MSRLFIVSWFFLLLKILKKFTILFLRRRKERNDFERVQLPEKTGAQYTQKKDTENYLVHGISPLKFLKRLNWAKDLSFFFLPINLIQAFTSRFLSCVSNFLFFTVTSLLLTFIRALSKNHFFQLHHKK